MRAGERASRRDSAERCTRRRRSTATAGDRASFDPRQLAGVGAIVGSGARVAARHGDAGVDRCGPLPGARSGRHTHRRDQRPVVEDGGRLLRRRQDVPGLRRRRLRRSPRADVADRLPRRPGCHVLVADALPSLAAPRRRVRHHRLLRRRLRLRLARGLRPARADGPRPRPPRDRRPGRQPHVRPPSVVPGRAHEPRLAVPRLVHLGRRAARRRRGDRLPRRGGLRLDVRRPGRPVLPAPLPIRTTGPQPGQSRRARRDGQGHGLLAGHGCLGLPRRRRPVPGGGPRARLRPAAVDACVHVAPFRRGHPARREQPRARRPARVLRAARRHAQPAVQLRAQPGDAPGLRALRP